MDDLAILWPFQQDFFHIRLMGGRVEQIFHPFVWLYYLQNLLVKKAIYHKGLCSPRLVSH